jgi:hypothetical protein
MVDGLRTLRALGDRNYGPAVLLEALYLGVVDRGTTELPADLIDRAIAWALGLSAESSLVPVADILLVGVRSGLGTEETLGRMFGVPAFRRPVSADDREWRSSPGSALHRVALGLLR